MNNLTKKLVVGFLALSMALTATAGAFAQEDTSDDVAEIEALAESLGIDASVLLEGLGVESQTEEEEEEAPSIAGIPEGFTFNNNMAQGAEGEAVKYLQILLNTNEDTQVAEEGPGSPGNETEYFGPVTRAAVITFQEKYDSEVLQPVGLSQGTGYVGSSTRAKLNELLGEGGQGAEAPSTSMSAVLEQLQELATALQDLRERVDSLDPGSEDAEEGELSTDLRSDIRNAELSKNETKDVAMYRVDAENSDVTVQRFDVYVDGSMTDFRSDIDHMALKVDGDVIGEQEINRSTVERDDEYIRFSGLNVEVLEGDYQDFTIEVTAADDDGLDATYGVGPAGTDAIRGIDGANLTVYADSNGTYREFDLVDEDTASLEIEDADSPEEGIVEVDDEDDTEVELLNFDLEAENSDLDFEKLVVDFDVDNSAVTWGTGTDEYQITDIFQDALLYHDGDLVDVQTVEVGDTDDAGSVTFDPEMDLDADSVSEFTVAVDTYGIDPEGDDADLVGTQINASIADDADNEGIAYAYDTEEYVDLTGDLTGEYQELFPLFPSFDLTSADIERNADEDSASAALTFEITAENGDIYLPSGNITLSSYADAVGSASGDITWNAVMDVDGEAYDSEVEILEGETVEVDIVANTEFSGTGDYSEWVRMAVDTITWGTESSPSTTYDFSDSYDFIEDLRTNRVYISGTIS